MKKKTIILLLALVLVVGGVIGGTIAWLTAATDPVTNTFTVGDINITLAETKTDFKMVPGNEIEKDPKVTVEANSEDCWLFVKVTKSDNLDDFITYDMANGWTPLTGVDGVYYRSVSASDANQAFSVLADDKVTVKTEVTKAQMNALTDETRPTLTFKAYAVQKDNMATAEAAWAAAAFAD